MARGAARGPARRSAAPTPANVCRHRSGSPERLLGSPGREERISVGTVITRSRGIPAARQQLAVGSTVAPPWHHRSITDTPPTTDRSGPDRR